MKDIIKKLLKEDNLDWIGNVSSDYWDYYDAVVFKKVLFDDEFKKFIKQALKSVQPTNASDWEEDDEMSDLEYLNYRIRRHGQAFIGKYKDEKGRNVLIFGQDPGYELYPQVKDAKTINYEDIKKGLFESDDFKWIRDTKVGVDMEYLHGYYFRWSGDHLKRDRKFWVDDVSNGRFYYSWEERGERLSNSLPISDMYNRFESGEYILYDKNDNKMDPKNITWFNEGNDDEIGPKDMNESSDDWGWTESPTVIIGGKGGYPKVEVKLGDKIIDNDGDVWVIEDITPSENNWVWGKDMKLPWLGPKNDEENKNWTNPMWLRKYDENINESDDFDWARDTIPVELEDPKDWVGRSFGYGPEIIDEMSGAEIAMGDDKEYYTIDGIDRNGNLSLTRHHPHRRSNSDSSTSVNFLRDYISNGRWVWV